MTDSKERFSNRVENYVRYRPSYPAEVLDVLKRETDFSIAAIVADIGSGTGISTKLFLEHGNTVYGVEPNREMRQAGEKLLADFPRFHSVEGTAEETSLANRSVDFVVAGQAFHWFNRENARQEFLRILHPGGWVLLMWNDRRIGSTEFLRDYETLLQEFATDYRQVDHKLIDEAVIQTFFAPATAAVHRLENAQLLDLDGLIGRAASSSYMPAEGQPRYAAMVHALEQLFNKHQQAERVKIEYDTVLYLEKLE